MKLKLLLLLLLPMLLGATTVHAQQKPKFSIVSFEQDKFDDTAKNKQYEKVDGNGSRYAIIKVTSATANDDLRAYRFNFGNLNSLVEEHDGELWVYVQRNAKIVTITRDGYTPINKYDLNHTIEAGETYNMRLSSAGKVVNYQMVMFSLKPATANAIIMVKGNQQGAKEELFGTTDDSGMTAKSLEFGTYTYRVIADNYHSSEGRLILDDKTKTHIEEVPLKSNHAEIILTVDADADIYINKEKRGTREWKGILKAGTYEITCRQEGHQPSTRFITVEENTNQTVALTPPTPITGELSITSRPLGAAISIDGQEYGQTPRIINDLLIGQHTVTLTKDNYNAETQSFEVKEGEMTEISLTMAANGMGTSENNSLVSQQVQNNSEVQAASNDLFKKLTGTTNLSPEKKIFKKAKRMKRIGGALGGVMFACGTALIPYCLLTTSSGSRYHVKRITLCSVGSILVFGGISTTTACLIRAHNIKKRASKYAVQSTSLYHHDFMLKNGASFSTGVDLLKDNMHHTPTLGIGLSYNF